VRWPQEHRIAGERDDRLFPMVLFRSLTVSRIHASAVSPRLVAYQHHALRRDRAVALISLRTPTP